MSAPMGEERLADIAAREAAATPGPWGTYDDCAGRLDIVADLEETPHGYTGRREIAQTVESPMDNDPSHTEWDEDEDREQSRADGVFIAHARTDVPALLAEIERLTTELAKYVGQEPTLAEEALYEHEQQVRARIAQDVNRARRPEFPTGERPDLIVATTRAIDIRLIEMGPEAPYWVPEAGESR